MSYDEVVLAHLDLYDRYYVQKENMTWACATLYVGASALLLGAHPFWRSWPPLAFAAFVLILLFTASIAFAFVHWQFHKRRIASDCFEAHTRVAARWATAAPEKSDLCPIEVTDLGKGHLMFSAVAREYLDVKEGRTRLWRPQWLTYIIMGLWTIATFLRVITSWFG